jgi:hypothetical protein
MPSTYVSFTNLKISPFDPLLTMKPLSDNYIYTRDSSCLKGKNVNHHKLSNEPTRQLYPIVTAIIKHCHEDSKKIFQSDIKH